MRFIYCENEESKEKLLNNGLKLMTKQVINGNETYVFLNNNKLNFDNLEGVKPSDKLLF